MNEKYLVITEENEWEGEEWNVYIPYDEAGRTLEAAFRLFSEECLDNSGVCVSQATYALDSGQDDDRYYPKHQTMGALPLEAVQALRDQIASALKHESEQNASDNLLYKLKWKSILEGFKGESSSSKD